MLMLFLILLDQVTKYWAYQARPSFDILGKFFRMEYIQNTGTIFGFFPGANTILLVLAVLLCIFMLWYMKRNVKKHSLEEKAFYLILAGGIGNFIDRLFRGFVVDFMALKYVGVFNVADMCVVLGVTLLIIEQLFFHNEDISKARK